MNHLIAKTKTNKGKFLKVISEQDIFSIPSDLDNTVAYQPGCLLGEQEWFIISKFSEQDYCIDFLKRSFVSAEYENIKTADYGNIDYLCSIQSNLYFFQKATSNLIMRKKWININEPTILKNEPIIVINYTADAIYNTDTDILYFKKLPTTIFQGIEILYRTATETETKEFLESSFLTLDENYTTESVKTANRKRIAHVKDIWNSYTKEEQKEVINYTKEYCENIVYKKGAFQINNEEDLKNILYGLEQRYFTTISGEKEKRVANSYITIAKLNTKKSK